AHTHVAKVDAPQLTLTAKTQTPLTENTATAVTLFLSQQGKGVGVDQLETVHTEKVHALIIDPSLTDYQHIHPTPGNKPGEYRFNFTPKTPYAYRIWLDITPVGGTQQYISTDILGKNPQNPPVAKLLATKTEVDGYQFKLSFDQPLKVGQSVMGSVMITDKNGQEVKTLEPLMEAFAHIVAFNEDYRTILHVHPMGAAPKDPKLRGGPRIDFHMTPTAAGFVKIFVQVKINGAEIFAPLGVNVQ
ncbi:MAG TPA: hypothetical protein VI522_08205, partial [Gammaproteobacteria bacterium]|nr:hypothetical protein [Gammaproteobacteria bacterium]